jgi:hypothetical protein
LDARSDLRHELKFACHAGSVDALRTALRLDRAGLGVLFPPRRVQSLYLDTTFGRALEENLAGIGQRRKLRFRWYGAGAQRVRGTLELKCRENTLGWKETLALMDEVQVEGAGRHAFVQELARGAPPAWSERLHHGLEPAQWVAYTREYFTTADRRVRVTLDQDLALCDQRLRARLSARARSPAPNLAVLELKCSQDDVEAAEELVARLPIQLGRCSKFVLASQAADGPIPSFLWS